MIRKITEETKTHDRHPGRRHGPDRLEQRREHQEGHRVDRALTKDVEAGSIYTGKVTRLMAFGAFVEILPGKEGLVHISELANYRVPTRRGRGQRWRRDPGAGDRDRPPGPGQPLPPRAARAEAPRKTRRKRTEGPDARPGNERFEQAGPRPGGGGFGGGRREGGFPPRRDGPPGGGGFGGGRREGGFPPRREGPPGGGFGGRREGPGGGGFGPPRREGPGGPPRRGPGGPGGSSGGPPPGAALAAHPGAALVAAVVTAARAGSPRSFESRVRVRVA